MYKSKHHVKQNLDIELFKLILNNTCAPFYDTQWLADFFIFHELCKTISVQTLKQLIRTVSMDWLSFYKSSLMCRIITFLFYDHCFPWLRFVPLDLWSYFTPAVLLWKWLRHSIPSISQSCSAIFDRWHPRPYSNTSILRKPLSSSV